jgi:hypothetical protein
VISDSLTALQVHSNRLFVAKHGHVRAVNSAHSLYSLIELCSPFLPQIPKFVVMSLKQLKRLEESPRPLQDLRPPASQRMRFFSVLITGSDRGAIDGELIRSLTCCSRLRIHSRVSLRRSSISQ